MTDQGREPKLGTRAVFFASDLDRFQDSVEQALWDLLTDHHEVDQKTIRRTMDAAIDNVEHQMGVLHEH